MAKDGPKNTLIGKTRFLGDQMFVCNFKVKNHHHFHFLLMAKKRIFEMLQCYSCVTWVLKNAGLKAFLKKHIKRLYISPFDERGFCDQNCQFWHF